MRAGQWALGDHWDGQSVTASRSCVSPLPPVDVNFLRFLLTSLKMQILFSEGAHSLSVQRGDKGGVTAQTRVWDGSGTHL